MFREFLRGSRAGWWWCCSWPCSGRARPGWWSGAYGGGWIGVMRSSSRSGSWRPVRALAWWGRALSGTTAILPVPVSCWSRSGARVVCQVSRFCSVGYGATVLLVGEGVGEGLGRPLPVHGRPGALPFRGLHAAGPGLVLQAGLADRVHLPALVQQGLDLGRRPGHASGGGRLVAVLVERVRAVRDSARTGAGAAGTRSPTGVRRRTGSSRRHVSPGRPRTRREHPPGRAAGPGRPWVPASVRGRVPPRPGSRRGRPGPGASWWPATRPAIPAPFSRPARPFQR